MAPGAAPTSMRGERDPGGLDARECHPAAVFRQQKRCPPHPRNTARPCKPGGKETERPAPGIETQVAAAENRGGAGRGGVAGRIKAAAGGAGIPPWWSCVFRGCGRTTGCGVGFSPRRGSGCGGQPGLLGSAPARGVGSATLSEGSPDAWAVSVVASIRLRGSPCLSFPPCPPGSAAACGSPIASWAGLAPSLVGLAGGSGTGGAFMDFCPFSTAFAMAPGQPQR